MNCRDRAASDLFWDVFPHPFAVVSSFCAHGKLNVLAPKKPVWPEINHNSHLSDDIGRRVPKLHSMCARNSHSMARGENRSERSLAGHDYRWASYAKLIIPNLIHPTSD